MQQKHCTTLLKRTAVELIVKGLQANKQKGGSIQDNNNTIKKGPGGDTDPSKAGSGDKGPKAQSPFEGEGKADEAKDLQASNGIMQNGLEDRQSGSRQNSPSEADGSGQMMLNAVKPDDHLAGLEVPPQQMLHLQLQQQQQQHPSHHMGLQLDTQHFDMGGPGGGGGSVDPFQITVTGGADYGGPGAGGHLPHMPPSMDSPNFNIDYQAQRQQQPITVLTPQQYALAQQQQQHLGKSRGEQDIVQK